MSVWKASHFLGETNNHIPTAPSNQPNQPNHPKPITWSSSLLPGSGFSPRRLNEVTAKPRCTARRQTSRPTKPLPPRTNKRRPLPGVVASSSPKTVTVGVGWERWCWSGWILNALKNAAWHLRETGGKLDLCFSSEVPEKMKLEICEAGKNDWEGNERNLHKKYELFLRTWVVAKAEAIQIEASFLGGNFKTDAWLPFGTSWETLHTCTETKPNSLLLSTHFNMLRIKVFETRIMHHASCIIIIIIIINNNNNNSSQLSIQDVTPLRHVALHADSVPLCHPQTRWHVPWPKVPAPSTLPEAKFLEVAVALLSFWGALFFLRKPRKREKNR